MVTLGSSKIEFGGKELLLGLKHFVIAGLAGGVTFCGKFDRLFKGRHLARLLLADFTKSVARGQGVGDVAQSGQSCLLVAEPGLVPGGLGLMILSHQAPAFKQRAARLRGNERFETVDALVAQMREDVNEARFMLA